MDLLKKSLDYNKQTLKSDVGSKFENYCASFLMAGSIGISTIEALNAIQVIESMSDQDMTAKR